MTALLYQTLTRLLLKVGGGVCVDPDPSAFKKLQATHKDNESIQLLEYAVTDTNGQMTFLSSGSHLAKGDTGLLSTLHEDEARKWTTNFKQVSVNTINVGSLLSLCKYKIFEFINIDCEGEDYNILSQLPLSHLQTNLVCVEWNSRDIDKYLRLMFNKGYRLLHRNMENLIFKKV